MKHRFYISTGIRNDGSQPKLMAALQQVTDEEPHAYGFSFFTYDLCQANKLVEVLHSFGFKWGLQEDYSISITSETEESDFAEADFCKLKNTRSYYAGKSKFYRDGILLEKKELRKFSVIQNEFNTLVTAAFRRKIEKAGLRGFLFRPVYLQDPQGQITLNEKVFLIDSANIAARDLVAGGGFTFSDIGICTQENDLPYLYGLREEEDFSGQDIVVSYYRIGGFFYIKPYFSPRFVQLCRDHKVKDIELDDWNPLQITEGMPSTIKAFEPRVHIFPAAEKGLSRPPEIAAPNEPLEINFFKGCLQDFALKVHTAKCWALGERKMCLQFNAASCQSGLHLLTVRDRLPEYFNKCDILNLSLEIIERSIGSCKILHTIKPYNVRLQPDGGLNTSLCAAPENLPQFNPHELEMLIRTPPLLAQNPIWYADKDGAIMDFIGRWSAQDFVENCPQEQTPLQFFLTCIDDPKVDEKSPGKVAQIINLQDMNKLGQAMMFRGPKGDYAGFFLYSDADENKACGQAEKQAEVLTCHIIEPFGVRLQEDGTLEDYNCDDMEALPDFDSEQLQKLLRTPALVDGDETFWFADENGAIMDFIGHWSSDDFIKSCPSEKTPLEFFLSCISGLYADPASSTGVEDLEELEDLDSLGETLMFCDSKGDYAGLFIYNDRF